MRLRNGLNMDYVGVMQGLCRVYTRSLQGLYKADIGGLSRGQKVMT